MTKLFANCIYVANQASWSIFVVICFLSLSIHSIAHSLSKYQLEARAYQVLSPNKSSSSVASCSFLSTLFNERTMSSNLAVPCCTFLYGLLNTVLLAPKNSTKKFDLATANDDVIIQCNARNIQKKPTGPQRLRSYPW